VAIALLPVLGRPVSPATVSAVAKQRDAAVAAFHRWPLKDSYRVLVLERFLGDLVHRGLTGERLEMLCVDGGSGLLAALPTAFPDIPIQRRWAHKIRNVLSKVRKSDQAAIKAGLHRIMKVKPRRSPGHGGVIQLPSREYVLPAARCRRPLRASAR
jgi:transposase-like protein